jgi:hypothetical protein
MKNAFLLGTFVLALVLAPVTTRGAAGHLYEADFSSGTIFQFATPLLPSPTPSGNPAPTPTATPKKVTYRTGITDVRGLAFDRSGNLFASQSETIIKITPSGVTSVFASGLHGPNFLAVDAAENLYASDREGHVLKFTPQGVKSIFAAGLNKPTGLAFDVVGNLFVADYAANVIFKYTPSGVQSTFALGLNGPEGLAFDKRDILYVANNGTKSVEAFTSVGEHFTRVINIASPVGLAVDNAGVLFVSDDCNGTGTNSIYKFTGTENTGALVASTLGCPLQLVFEPPRAPLANISTRARVDNAPNHELIAGFIISGSDAKTVLIRAIGPSLGKSGITQPLADSILELHTPGGTVTNDNWMDSQKTDIQSTGLAPKDDRESAILVTLSPGNYTAIVRGHPEMPSGVALVEVYDLDPTANSTLANISSRGFVQTGDNTMIAGFIVAGGNGAGKVLIRVLGPSLRDAGIEETLQDPMLSLTLRDANGNAFVYDNDDWSNSTQAFEIYATGIPPPGSREAAIVATLPSGQYTAVVRGLDAQGTPTGTGVGLIEVYNLR